MSPLPERRFRRLALATTTVTLILVGVGGLVRATGSGLGCLDAWPSCRGGWTAPADAEGIIEYGHRALAAVAIVLVVLTAIAARRWTADRQLHRWSMAAAVPFVVQAGIGAVVVKGELHAALVTVHFLAAMFLVFATVRVAALAYLSGRPPATGRVAKMASGAAIGTFAVLLAGTLVRERGAGLAFSDWPLMAGTPLPPLTSAAAVLQFVHRLLAALVFIHVIMTWVRCRSDRRGAVRVLGAASVVLYAAQVAAGAANVFSGLSAPAVLTHVFAGSLTWACVAALAVVSRHDLSATQPRLGAYAALTKPRIVSLLLITTVPAMVLAAQGMPPGRLILATLVGGSLSAAGANAINQYVDRDIDGIMRRTVGRPLPSSRIEPRHALWFGITLGAVAFGWLAWTVNVLSAVLSVSALLFYVFVYSLWLKRTSPQNIVIGGAAGAVPCLVGWAAVTGTLAWPAWLMFAIVFLWTPPHFWALAVRYRDDYAAAGVPMLPVVRTLPQTARQILLYTLALVPVTILLWAAARLGPIYAATALILGGLFVLRAVRLVRVPTADAAFGLFRYSIVYLALLFIAMGADRLVVR